MVTAWSLDKSITGKDLLIHEAGILQENLAVKERLVYNFIDQDENLKLAERYHIDSDKALAFIDLYREMGVNLLVYNREKLQFWSTSRIEPAINNIKEGTSFTQFPNGWYELIKKTKGDYTFLFIITVKNQFSIENQYLKSQIAPELFSKNTLDLASFNDKETVDIFSINKEYLFPVKLNYSDQANTYKQLELWLWLIGLFSICLFVNSYCNLLASMGLTTSATLILTIFFIAIRLSDLEYAWLNNQLEIEIFNPTIYAQSDLLPSLGGFLLNVLAITWVCFFAYSHRHSYTFPNWMTKSKVFGIVLHLLFLLVLGELGFLIEDVFFGLIDNSKINFEITNIVNMDFISWICIFILCLVWLDLFLVISVCLTLSKKLNVSLKLRLILFLTALSAYFIYKLIDGFTVFFLAYALLIFIMAWNNYVQHNRFSISSFAALFFCLAFLSSIKYNKFNDMKERATRKHIAEKLLQADDPKVINFIAGFESNISSDSLIATYFKNPSREQSFQIHNYISKKYLDGYLERFDYKIYEYNPDGVTLKNDNSPPLSKYKSLIQSGAMKTSDANYFYRINDTFGFQSYFGMIPILNNGNILGSMVIELKSQPFDYNNYFPDLLIDGKLKSDEDFSAYSIAFYKDNKLFSQSGMFTYEMLNKKFTGIKDRFEFKNDKVLDYNHHQTLDYNHLIFKPDQSKLIIISKEKLSFVVRLATLSFFFLVFILFSASLYCLIWLFKNLSSRERGWFNLNRYLLINANKILYKTRIQVSIVLAVVATLLIVGWTTFYFIKSEYIEQQDNVMREKVRKVKLAYEKTILNGQLPPSSEQAKFEFNQFADINAAFINLYDAKGNLYLTNLPKMYDYGIVGAKIGAKAFIYLSLRQSSEFLNTSERIGDFNYAAGYAPIRNVHNQTIAYIGLPYFTTDADYQAKIGLFINTLINIYALVFVLIGVLAVFLANQITYPLTFIQESIRRTKLGERNQPIIWHRQDEIGLMINEYNKMLAELEKSAIKLARSERESAWREMAKQVAHEIKNPLTPLKLGVQLLEKSWKERDPNFDMKFAKFNHSFIEQIDSLATIASEFSNFAKMPDTKLESIDLLEIIEQAIGVFNIIEHVEITLINQTNGDLMILGDKDQLLRTFNNLLKNAIEATEGKEEGLVGIKINNDSQYVFIEVGDNGKGIDKNLEHKIFAPNFTTKSSGTGLGLAFVKQAIENAGGTIDFKSSTNVGTTFYISFPLLTIT